VSRVSHGCVPADTTRTPPRTVLPTPTLLYQWREVLRCRKYDLSPNSAAYECRWNCKWPRKAHRNASAASALDTRSEPAVTHPGASRVEPPTTPVVALPHGNSPSAVAAGETTANYRGCVKWKEAKAVLAKQAPDRGRKSATTAHLTARKNSGPRPVPSRLT